MPKRPLSVRQKIIRRIRQRSRPAVRQGGIFDLPARLLFFIARNVNLTKNRVKIM